MQNDRRDFLKRIGVAGLIAATKDLPAVTPKPFAIGARGPHSRLGLSYAVVEIGLAKPFSVLHISDTHLSYAYPDEHQDKVRQSEERTMAFGGRQEEALAESLAWAKANVDYVVHTGDLIDFKSRANFDLVRKYWGTGIAGSMGNHEFYEFIKNAGSTHDEAFKASSWQDLRASYPVDPRFDSTVINGVNFVCLDDVFDTVQPDLVERFRSEVKKGLPIVLCLHVPLYTSLTKFVSWKNWRAKSGSKIRDYELFSEREALSRQESDPVTREFVAYLKSEPLLKAILSGHEHLTFEDRFSPTCIQYLVGGNFIFQGRVVIFR